MRGKTMNAYQQKQHRNGIEAAEIAIDISADFAAEMVANMESRGETDADYLAGYKSVVNA